MEIQVGNLKKIKNSEAKQVLTEGKFYDPSARNLIETFSSSKDFLAALIKDKFFKDAISFLSHGLPSRERVWWGCVCVRETLKEETNPLEVNALEASEKWVYAPSEKESLAAKSSSEKLEFKTPASWLAMATFWSQGNITPLVKTPDNLVENMISGAIMLAASILDPSKIEDNYQKFIFQGIDIANGGNGKN